MSPALSGYYLNALGSIPGTKLLAYSSSRPNEDDQLRIYNAKTGAFTHIVINPTSEASAGFFFGLEK